MQTECPIALGTDDVGVFESSLANEYFIAASEFGLGRGEVVGLARRAVEATFQEGGRKRMERLIVEFEKRMEL
jgi:adenosine deaminase